MELRQAALLLRDSILLRISGTSKGREQVNLYGSWEGRNITSACGKATVLC